MAGKIEICHCNILLYSFVQAFLDFRGFDFRKFWFTSVDDSNLFSSPLVLLSDLHLRGFCFSVIFLSPHINSLNRGMPAYVQ